MRWCQKFLPNSEGNTIVIDSLSSDDSVDPQFSSAGFKEIVNPKKKSL